MTPENFIKGQLLAFAFREAAHHGGTDNMLAVAFVIRNRVKAGWSGGNWMAVIQSHMNVSAVSYPRPIINMHDTTFRILLQSIDDIFNGLAVDRMTEGALYYCELNRVEREWFQKHIVGDPLNHPRVATVGNVSFFK